MKKIIFAFTCLILLSFLVFTESKAQSCPPGYTLVTIQVPYEESEITIHYCMGVGPGGGWSVFIVDIMIPWEPNCIPNLTIDATFMNFCIERVRLHFKDNGGPFPPCPNFTHNAYSNMLNAGQLIMYLDHSDILKWVTCP